MHILIKPGTCPETVSLIAVDLIESFFDGNATALQFHMNQGQTIDQDGDIIPGIVASGTFLILIDDLQTVVMDVFLINQIDILRSAIFAGQILNIVLLDLAGFLHDMFIRIGNLSFEEGFPLFVREAILIQTFKLLAKIFHKICFIVNRNILIALFAKHLDKRCFQGRFTLVGIGASLLGFIFGNNSGF